MSNMLYRAGWLFLHAFKLDVVVPKSRDTIRSRTHKTKIAKKERPVEAFEV